jgi:hypothetical protein
VSNKRKLVAVGSAAAGAALWARQARRRARAQRAAAEIAEAIMPSVAAEADRTVGIDGSVADEAHAPGHTHLAIPTHVAGAEAHSQRQQHDLAHQQPEIKRRG